MRNEISLASRSLFFILLASFASFLMFQNCSQVEFATIDKPSNSSLGEDDNSPPDNVPDPLPDPEAPVIGASSLLINGGAAYTNNIDVMLSLESQNATEMLVSNSNDCSEGTWEPLRTSRGWKLNDQNQAISVYAKFRNDGAKYSPCIQASIVHDDKAPIASFLTKQPEFTNQPESEFAFNATDELSGIERLECKLNSENFARCTSPLKHNIANEGIHTFQVRAVDRAGNISRPIEQPWSLDRTAPVVILVQTPPHPSRSPKAEFKFTVTDGTATGSSQVSPADVICRWQHTENVTPPVEVKGCESPKTLTGLAEGTYRFEVVAKDRAGNESNTASYTWLIDTLPPHAFDITGITGGTDTQIDAYLGTVPQPTVHWSPSQDADHYLVSIATPLDRGNAVVCAEQTTKNTVYPFAPADCELSDGEKYVARVVALDAVGNSRETSHFLFTVDLTPPATEIQLSTELQLPNSQQVNFTIVDEVSGVKEALCYRIHKGAMDVRDCKSLTSINYTNLPLGEHSFQIVASDNAGNRHLSREVKFLIEELRLVKHQLTVQQPLTKVDILVVIDNSGSMKTERTKLGQRLGDFTGQLGGLDWQICVTTTETTHDGQLVKFNGSSLYMINKITPNYNSLFLNTLQNPPAGLKSGSEQGILATVRAAETKDARCIRNDAAFSVILISDEDEMSNGGWPEFTGGHNSPLGTKNLPETAVATVRASMGAQKIFTFHSIVVRSGDTACYAEQDKDSTTFYGRRYEALSAMTNGLVGNICAPDYGYELREFAKRIEKHLDSITLECEPYLGVVDVKVNSVALDKASYAIAGDKLKFSPPLTPGSVVDIQYTCRIE